VIVSGVSPFLDDSLDETCSNIIRRDFCFPHEYFSGVSGDAKDFISMLLVSDVGLVFAVRLLLNNAYSQMALLLAWLLMNFNFFRHDIAATCMIKNAVKP